MSSALHTDLYQLTMMAANYHQRRGNTIASCELFVRKLPQNRKYIVVAGIEQALEYLQNVKFSDNDIEVLKQNPIMRPVMTPDFVRYLRGFSFEGIVRCVPEGSIVFANEPIISITGRLNELQLIETYLLSCINYNSLIASKASRMIHAAQGRSLYEFGTRRTHVESSVDAARAAYIAGFDGSSNVEAFSRYGIPARGTMAHMYVMAHKSEKIAFEEYGKIFKNSTYLVDTYDTLQGVKNAVEACGENIAAVRIDSGDLSRLSLEVKEYLKSIKREDIKIFLSGDLDEYRLDELSKNGYYDAAGVGTKLVSSDDSPSIGAVYKIVEIGYKGVVKLSEGKNTYPQPKQVYRFISEGKMDKDVIGLTREHESIEALGGQEQLKTVDLKTFRPTPLAKIQEYCLSQQALLKDELRSIDNTDTVAYPVVYSTRLDKAFDTIKKGTNNDKT